MEKALKRWVELVLLVSLLSANGNLIFIQRTLADGVTAEEAILLRDEVREMFYHAFDGYMEHAFPRDELRPLSCEGEDTLGGYALTLIDSLDTLALLGDRERFTSSVEWIAKNLRFDINKTVSVFETSIRVLGGLLSAHLLASDYATGMRIPSYDNQLLDLAEDLARRMLPAFDTPTGIPFGSVNLLHGVDEHESKITSTAGGGTLTLEFGVLSRLTNNPSKYSYQFQLAIKIIILYLAPSCNWDAGIGTSIDSFYEYLLKVLAGDIDPAIRTHAAFFSVWKRYGFTPEGFNLATLSVQNGQKSYPLRPELIESTYWLYKATRDARYLDAGREMVASLQYGARCPCGYCHITDVEFHKQEDHMESFFLAETVKYLWLLFDLASGPDNLVENGPYKYIFSTEGHLLPATPQISLVGEHCSYFGAYCRSGDSGSLKSGISMNPQETNASNGGQFRTGYPLHSSFFKSTDTAGFMKGICPGLTHGEKYGISYLESIDATQEDESTHQRENVVKSHSVMVVADNSLSNSNDHLDNVQESSEVG
ncbi:alpha-mannosidase I MNS4 [Jatropha curcas]|uniref:alpha-mannosidase I MNS4 n=1 Tax=Jatropha curcas TaxID=180498 RepID=UPI001895F84B|nr:alpha-mannosidase I MNS4 [Jatropha curcas]